MSVEARILAIARNAFMQMGVRSVTMDDLAQTLGVSKKTIYQFYANKAELVDAVARDFFEQEKSRTEAIIQESPNAIEELVRLVAFSVNTFRRMAPHLVTEVQKYYPEAWGYFESFRSGFVLEKVTQNLHRGMQEGLYRNDLEIDIVAQMRVMQIDGSLRHEFFPPERFDQARVQLVIFEHYLRSLVTPHGQQLLEPMIRANALSFTQS